MARPPRFPGAVTTPATAGEAGDDLDAFEPGAPLPEADPVMVELAALKAELSKVKRTQQGMSDSTKARERQIDAQTQDEAREMAEADIARGVRPRALLTPDGWYVHPELTRGPGSLGNKAP